MLTCCGCLANPEQTAILTPCQLHHAWALVYAPQWVAETPEHQRAPLAHDARPLAQERRSMGNATPRWPR